MHGCGHTCSTLHVATGVPWTVLIVATVAAGVDIFTHSAQRARNAAARLASRSVLFAVLEFGPVVSRHPQSTKSWLAETL